VVDFSSCGKYNFQDLRGSIETGTLTMLRGLPLESLQQRG
jgi:hypothetical protein